MPDKQTDEQIAEENRRATDLPEDRAEPTRESDTPPPQEQRDTPPEPEDKKIPVGSKYASKRDRLYQKHRENREPGEGEEEFAAVPSDREKVFFGENVETRTDREARRREERGEDTTDQQPTDDGQDPPVEEPAQTRQRLKVHGREVELSDDEVKALAQKALAAEDILGEAKQLRTEQTRLLEELRNARADHSQDGKQPSAPQGDGDPATEPDDDELDAIIDDIQTGGREEAKAAFRKYGDSLEQRMLERIGNLDERIAETTQTLNETNERQRQTRQTLEEFSKEYPEFSTSAPLQSALAHETAARMRQEMINIGVREETLDGIKQKYGFDETQAAAFAYRTLQQRGHELKDHGSLLRESADSLRSTFGAPAAQKPAPASEPAKGVDERIERKRTMAPQPRRATTAPSSDTRERTREEARKEAVRQMRVSRGKRA